LVLAEAIERETIPIHDRTIVELGAGTALPSLLAASREEPASLVTITDYPDELIMANLRKNVQGNQHSFAPGCRVNCVEYEWGKSVETLTTLLGQPQEGYDVVILSDLLHFRSSHDDLVKSTVDLLCKKAGSRVYVGAGKYTSPQVCQNFLQQAEKAGIEWEARENDGIWRGSENVGAWSLDELNARKANVNWWSGKWKESE